ncbi:MAG: FecR domain-containing protein [Candidatus Dojkabacteria bacterium]
MMKFLFALALIALVFVGGLIILPRSNLSGADSFILVLEEGEVFYKTSGEYIQLDSDEIKLESGTFVKTGDGLAHVILADNSLISMDKDTEMQVSFDDEGTDIQQLIGNTWHRVQKLSSDQEYEVETPNLLAAVRGTKFGVNVAGSDDSEVFVVEDTVKVGEFEKKDGKRVFKDSYDLVKDKHFALREGKTEMGEIQETLRKMSWFINNTKLDTEFDKADFSEFKSNFRERIILKLRPELIDKIQDNRDGILNRVEIIEERITLGEILNRYRLETSGSDLCSNVNNTTQFDEDVDLLAGAMDQSTDHADQLGSVLDYMGTVEAACEDGKIDEGEKADMKQILGPVDFDSQVDTIGFSEFESAIASRLDLYLNIVDDGRDICENYKNRSADDILSELTALEIQYDIEPRVAEDLGEQVRTISNACEDGWINQSEHNILFQLSDT